MLPKETFIIGLLFQTAAATAVSLGLKVLWLTGAVEPGLWLGLFMLAGAVYFTQNPQSAPAKKDARKEKVWNYVGLCITLAVSVLAVIFLE